MTEKEFAEWWYENKGMSKAETFFSEILDSNVYLVHQQPSEDLPYKISEAVWMLAHKVLVESEFPERSDKNGK